MTLRTTLLCTTLALAFGAAHAAGPLQLTVYNAGAGSFHVNSVLLSGEKEALLGKDALTMPLLSASVAEICRTWVRLNADGRSKCDFAHRANSSAAVSISPP